MNRLMMLAASALAMVSARAELPKDVTDNVPSELTEGFDLVYKSDIPVGMDWRNGAAVYSIDNRADEAFDRAAFYFQLVSADGTATNWVWIATDKYSAGVSTHELSIPFRGAGTLGRFKLNSAESHVKVASNVPNCDFRNAANPYVLVIESWYSNYNQYRNGEEFGGYDPYFDWNDTFQDVGDGYGCFNFIKVDTDMMNNGVPLLCVNGWGSGDSMSCGIGINNYGYYWDYTLTPGIDAYSVRAFYAFAHKTGTRDERGPLRVMPIGDSITQGVGWEDGSGYRAVLRQKLADAGFRVDMVGDWTAFPKGFSNSDISPVPVSDLEHSGHSGWSVDQVRQALPEWFRTVEDPHVILLHLGTNDLGQFYDMKHLIDRYDALIGEIIARQPSAHLIVSTLMYRGEVWYVNLNEHYIPTFNAALAERVAARQANGERVTLVDMCSKVAYWDDLPDALHPNANGYRKMADAWFEGIAKVVSVADFAAPVENELAVTDVLPAADGQSFTVWFNQPVSDTALVAANYVLTPETLTATAVTLAEDRRSAVVTVSSLLDHSANVSLTVSGVTNLSGAKTIMPQAMEVQQAYGAAKHVPAEEFGSYEKVYALDIPVVARYDQANGAPAYSTDTHAEWDKGSFDRIAYYMELVNARGQVTYAWVSMDAFTEDASKIAIPTVMSGALFQQTVDNLKIFSNAQAVTPGVRTQGNIEFWPYDYGAANKLGLPGAHGNFCDIDDTHNGNGQYGSLQIHDTENMAPIICYNCWGGYDSKGALGIGPSLANNNHTDWTYMNNADTYTRRVLEVYVHRGEVIAPAPKLVSSTVVGTGDEVVVQFDSPVYEAADLASVFTIADGPSVLAARRAAGDPSRVVLTLASAATGTVTVKVTGIRSDTASRTPGNGEIEAVHAEQTMFPLVADEKTTSGLLEYSISNAETGRAEPASADARLAWTHNGEFRMAGVDGIGRDAAGQVYRPAVLKLTNTDLNLGNETFTVAAGGSADGVNVGGNGTLILDNATVRTTGSFIGSCGTTYGGSANEIPVSRIELRNGSVLDAYFLQISRDVASGDNAYGYVTNVLVIGKNSTVKYGFRGLTRYNGSSALVLFDGGKVQRTNNEYSGCIFNPDNYSGNNTARYVVQNTEGEDCVVETDFVSDFYNSFWNAKQEFQLELTGAIRKLGTGTLKLNAPNPPGLKMNGIKVDSGTVACQWNLSGLAPQPITVSQGAALDISGGALWATFVDPMGGAGDVTASTSSGTLGVQAGETAATLSGAINLTKVSEGTFTAPVLGLTATETIVNGGTLKLLPGADANRMWRKYRFRVMATKANDIMEFCEIKLLDGETDMTRRATLEWDSTTPGFTGGFYGNGETPDRAVDGNFGTKLCDLRRYENRHAWWIGFDFGKPTRLTGYKWANSDNANREPTDWVLEASMDGENWTVLSEVTGYDKQGTPKTWVGDGEEGEIFALATVPHAIACDLGAVTVSDGATLDLSELGAEIHVTSIDGNGIVEWGSSALCVCKGRAVELAATVEVPRLRIDLSAETNGSLSNFRPTPEGVLELVNGGPASVKGRALPLTIGTFAQGAEDILKGWTVAVDGHAVGNAIVVRSGDGLRVLPRPGFTIVIR